ncbi:hypothetical protein EYZ11_007475 [Aspergillus tanneri]|nr:hypothetical protein EYZ11_007475 [Aspergillus tanneri]
MAAIEEEESGPSEDPANPEQQPSPGQGSTHGSSKDAQGETDPELFANENDTAPPGAKRAKTSTTKSTSEDGDTVENESTTENQDQPAQAPGPIRTKKMRKQRRRKGQSCDRCQRAEIEGWRARVMQLEQQLQSNGIVPITNQAANTQNQQSVSGNAVLAALPRGPLDHLDPYQAYLNMANNANIANPYAGDPQVSATQGKQNLTDGFQLPQPNMTFQQQVQNGNAEAGSSTAPMQAQAAAQGAQAGNFPYQAQVGEDDYNPQPGNVTIANRNLGDNQIAGGQYMAMQGPGAQAADVQNTGVQMKPQWNYFSQKPGSQNYQQAQDYNQNQTLDQNIQQQSFQQNPLPQDFNSNLELQNSEQLPHLNEGFQSNAGPPGYYLTGASGDYQMPPDTSTNAQYNAHRPQYQRQPQAQPNNDAMETSPIAGHPQPPEAQANPTTGDDDFHGLPSIGDRGRESSLPMDIDAMIAAMQAAKASLAQPNITGDSDGDILGVAPMENLVYGLLHDTSPMHTTPDLRMFTMDVPGNDNNHNQNSQRANNQNNSNPLPSNPQLISFGPPGSQPGNPPPDRREWQPGR